MPPETPGRDSSRILRILCPVYTVLWPGRWASCKAIESKSSYGSGKRRCCKFEPSEQLPWQQQPRSKW
ncbi:hypothetical protein B0H34DRAFT_686231 [Crassisporium funariophilum]|nr:hypothetical protein B0H34DRAFT_686231 [Crassisporium funariophilum]